MQERKERNDFMTDAKQEYFKFNPIYETKLRTENLRLDIIDEPFVKANVELSVVEKEGKQGLIRTIVRVDRYDRACWREEGLYPCIYDTVVPLGCKMGVGIFKLQKGDDIKVVLMKVASSPCGDEVVCFEVDV